MVEPIRIPRPEHCISRSAIDAHVVRVLYTLKHAGFQAYVVGGAVRDLLRGGRPKDFDIATDATPNELRRLFRRSRIVGRRFRLVHVLCGDAMVEVATLRQSVTPDDPVGTSEEDVDADLYISDDNAWGDVESDAFRRDFTINALFYDIYDFSLVDYVGGVADLHHGLIRSIGDPVTRFCEDPVRMLRAIKFAARFDYRIEAQTEAALQALPEEIHKASRFRVTEEIFRIISQRHRDRGFAMLHQYGLLQELFPEWIEAIGDEGFEQVLDYFRSVEAEAEQGRFVPLELLTAGLFLPLLDHVDPQRDRYQTRAAALAEELRRLSIAMDLPKRLALAASTLLRGQLYLLFFAHRKPSVQRFVTSPEFDWVWRLHDLAFGHLRALHGIQEAWLDARERSGEPIGGWCDGPDRRDVFSFRGRSGGGRRAEGELVSVLDGGGEDDASDRPARRRRRRRR